MQVEIVKEMPMNRHDVKAALVKKGAKYYLVSTSTFFGHETLVFPADSSGKVTSWLEVEGGRHMSRQDAINALNRNTEL